MVNALVVRRTRLPLPLKDGRAAQYVRMSTDYQRYSIQNQAAAIATFAQQKNLTIVRTYMDEGRSGLRIRGRPALIELIDDVRSGRADFEHILVYDVSRWGRFQDVDESAHYEFVCKENGIKVAYCAEQFDNDGSLLSSIVKNIKRVMAAEFSRELSVKVHAGHCRIASLGFRVGGPIGFALRRELVDESRHSKGGLTKGQRKALQTDRVLLRLGSNEEAAIVRWIFHQFVIEHQTDIDIARQLNRAGVANDKGRPWTDCMIHTILKNENYVGNLVYNRTSRRLGQRQVNNPRHLWVRSEAVIDPIVDRNLFARAQKIMAERYLSLPEDQMLLRLRLLLHRKGRLSFRIIEHAPGLPSVATYVKRFGSLRKAYALIGYKLRRDCDWIDTEDFWSEVLAKHATQVAEALRSDRGFQAGIDKDRANVTVVGETKIFFLTARQAIKRKPNNLSYWRVYRRKRLSGLLVVLRLDSVNRKIEDYLILPASRMRRRFIGFSDRMLHGATRVETLAGLITNLKRRFRGGSKPSVLKARLGKAS